VVKACKGVLWVWEVEAAGIGRVPIGIVCGVEDGPFRSTPFENRRMA